MPQGIPKKVQLPLLKKLREKTLKYYARLQKEKEARQAQSILEKELSHLPPDGSKPFAS